MARRHARLSVGALAFTGLAASTIGLSATAHADTVTVTQTYSCNTWALGVGDQGTSEVEVELTSDLPTQVTVGDEVTVPISASVEISPDRQDLLYNTLGARSIEGRDDRGNAGLNPNDAYNHALFSVDLGGTTTDGEIALTVPVTPVPAPSSGPLVVSASGTSDPIVASEAGTATVSAGDFQAYIGAYTGDNADGEFKTTIAMTCTNVSADKTLGTVEVVAPEPTDPEPTDPSPTDPEPTDPSPTDPEPTDPSPTDPEPTTPDEPAPTANDWYKEPGSISVTGEGVATLGGTASQDGTLTIKVYDENDNLLDTIVRNVSAGAVDEEFSLPQNAAYVTVTAGDCEVEGAEDNAVCTNTYVASWYDPDNTTDDSGDDTGTDPQRPDVVQTDSFQLVQPTEDGSNTAGLALGGLLLAGAGAGTILVARRRQAAQH